MHLNHPSLWNESPNLLSSATLILSRLFRSLNCITPTFLLCRLGESSPEIRCRCVKRVRAQGAGSAASVKGLEWRTHGCGAHPWECQGLTPPVALILWLTARMTFSHCDNDAALCVNNVSPTSGTYFEWRWRNPNYNAVHWILCRWGLCLFRTILSFNALLAIYIDWL